MHPAGVRTLGTGVLLVTLLSGCSRPDQSAPSSPAGEAADVVDAEIQQFQLARLRARLQTMPAGTERDYVSGVLASRSGRIDESTTLLNQALPALRQAHPQRAATALRALAESYLLSYRYKQAAETYDDLDQHYAALVHGETTDDSVLAHLLRDVLAQTVEWQGPVRLPTSRNRIGSWVSEIDIGDVREQWLLDTGANLSMLSESYARRLGLTPLAGVGAVGSGITGIKSAIRAAVVPRLRLGGVAVANVVAIVLDDSRMRIGGGADAFQLHAVLGYPVMQALGRITFTRDGQFIAGEAVADSLARVPIYLRGLTPAIECVVDAQPLLFTFDTGASSTDFSVRYFELFRRQEATWQRRSVESGGAGGTVQQEMYIQPTVQLKVGDATAILHDVSIFPNRMNAGIDVLFGNLGLDFVADFRAFTMDFGDMTFSLAR
jgi:predicted aspartyl protease